MFNDFIRELKNKQIEINYAKGKLTYSGPEEHIDSNLIGKLKEYKTKLIKHFWPEECWNIMPINPQGEKTPLALVHAGPANYPISDYLGSDRPFYGYFYIGSEGEKIRYKNLEAFAAEYLKQLQHALPDGPCYLGGLSLGGHLSFEMAIQLQKQGVEVPLLFLIDAGFPDDKRYLPKENMVRRMYEFGKKIYYWLYDMKWRFIYGYLTAFKDNIPAKKRNKYIRWTYKEYIKKYKPTEKYKGKIIIFRAEANKLKDKYMGWDRVCDDIEITSFKGDHGSMYHDEDSVDYIKKYIKTIIDDYELSVANSSEEKINKSA